MARRITGEATTKTKKAGTSARAGAAKVSLVSGGDVSKNGETTNVPVSLEEEIRRRAYELYLERRATAGAENGNEGQDWLVAEREIRSRQDSQEQHTA